MDVLTAEKEQFEKKSETGGHPACKRDHVAHLVCPILEWADSAADEGPEEIVSEIGRAHV